MDMQTRYRVWDLPSRLSHAAIAVLVLAQFASGLFELLPMSAHLWCGYALLVVVLFRILWGFFGSESARFSHFLHGPAEIMRYLRSLTVPPTGYYVEHNPLGGWSVLALLLVTLVQSISGLFAGHVGDLVGPLAQRFGRGVGHEIADLHEWLYWFLLLLVLIHIGAVVFYLVNRRQNLIGPMFGDGRLPLSRDPGLRFAGNSRAIVLFLVSVMAVAAVAVLGPR